MLYDEYVESQGCNAGFFFRYIHNLITFVIHQWGGEKQKDVAIGYLNFIQAQLTNEELALLFYDSISEMAWIRSESIHSRKIWMSILSWRIFPSSFWQELTITRYSLILCLSS